MLRLFLWIVLLWLALRSIRRLVDGISAGMTGHPSAGAQSPSVGLARDPVCGTYVVPSRSLSLGSGSSTWYFCSEKCRKAWAASR